MFTKPVEQLTFTIYQCKTKKYIQTGIYYEDDAEGEPQGSSHRNCLTLEESIELLKEFFNQLD
jgi:hypothetical protein